MAVHIRLARRGGTHRPFYHIVAADHRMRRDGRFIEKLGFYDPKPDSSTVEFKESRLRYWYSHGAALSPAVQKLLKIKQIQLKRDQATAET